MNKPDRTGGLDGLRALAALSVLAFHVWLYAPSGPPGPRTELVDKFLFQLNLGLICFFVLSGCLLYRSFAKAALGGSGRVDLKRYFRHRAARILPAYYACLIGCLALFLLVGYSTIMPAAQQLPLFAVFGQNYSPHTLAKLNPVTWTLSIEVAFYVALPLLGLIAYKLGPSRFGRQVLVIASLIGVTLAWNVLVNVNHWTPIGPKVLLAYLGHFALGMLVAIWVVRRKLEESKPLAPLATAGLVTLGMTLVVGTAYWHETVTTGSISRTVLANLPVALGFALLIAAIVAGRGPAVGWLGARPLVAIGLISYGVYLWHLPLLLVVGHVGWMPQAYAPRLAIVLVLSLAAAAASWRWVEQPMIARADSLGRRSPRSRRVRSRSARPAMARARAG